jgi:hypothetical protein
MISDAIALLDLQSADVAFRFVAVLVGVGQLVAAGQLIADRQLFDPGGLLAWPAVRRCYESSRLAAIASISFDAPAVVGVALLKCAGAVALVGAAAWQQPLLYALVVLVATNVALVVRIPYGRTGADEMGNVVLAALLLAACVGTPLAHGACLTFIAGASVMSYATAGISKLLNVGWRNGSVLRNVVSTAQYGNALAARMLTRSGRLSMSVSAAVISCECLFPVILVAPRELALVGLAAGVLFHVVLALVMGLNTFVWTFTATYPALLFVNSQLHRW